MTHEEKVIVSAYTGTMLCEFSDVQSYLQNKLGRPVFTHEIPTILEKPEVRCQIWDDYKRVCVDSGITDNRDDLIYLLTEADKAYSGDMPMSKQEFIADFLIGDRAANPDLHSFWLPIKDGFICHNCKTLGSSRWKVCPICEAKMERGKPNDHCSYGERRTDNVHQDARFTSDC